MVQIKTVVTALLTLSVATCTPIARRTAATVLADLASIGTDLTTLTSVVNSYTGGLTEAITIATDDSTLDTAIKQATTDTKAAGAFSVADSASITAALKTLAPEITAGLSALASKVRRIT
jgi:hypothetical protein